MTAFELCGQYDDEHFRLKGGSVIWESISYRDKCDKCYISRVVEPPKGIPWFMGLNMLARYIDPDTEIELVPK
jgi:hypothetical protein